MVGKGGFMFFGWRGVMVPVELEFSARNWLQISAAAAHPQIVKNPPPK